MGIDLSQYYVGGAAESQIGEGGQNAAYNCVPASFCIVFKAYGYDVEPQDLTNAIYGPGHAGGEDFMTVAVWCQKQYSWLPHESVSNPANTLDAIHTALSKGYPVIVEFKDDRNAQLVTGWKDATWHGTHASVVVAIGDTTVSIINVWDGSIQTFPHAVFQQATLNPAGNMVVFERSIVPPPPPPPPPPPVDPCADLKAQLAQAQDTIAGLQAKIAGAKAALG